MSMKNLVRALREQRGSLKPAWGVSHQAINAVETGKYDPSIWLAYALSKVFGCHIEDIFLFEAGAKK